MILFRFSRESRNDVGRETYVRNDLFDSTNEGEILVSRIRSIHQF